MFIDHFVWATPDLGLEMEHFIDISGVKPEYGGSHPGKGTHNALVRVGHACYLEIVAPDPLQHQIDRRWMIPQEVTHPRLIKWAWTSNDLVGDCERMDELGCLLGPVSTGKRFRNDGQWLHWKLTDPDFSDSSLVPFLISWGQDQHPALSLPLHCQLRSVSLLHPRPENLRFLELLSDFPVVNIEQGEELLSIEIEAPRGILQLSTEAPYCQVL
ncbi:MAG: VOC family protein [Saprospiraceae bacterium]|nr:VOC family protein [Saprospiraceae bacterium]